MRDAGAPSLLDVDIVRKTHARGMTRLDAVAGLRFSLPRGAVTCLLGPSGCGKTTALRIAIGLDRAFEGRVTPAPETLRLGVVFQEPRLLPWRTVEQNVRLAAPALSGDAMTALLGELGLEDWRRHRPNQISGGMARRVALARALAVEPDLLVLDEAFVSLDERNAEILQGVVFEAVARRSVTVLMVTHNVREALRFSDRILVLAPRPTQVTAEIALEAGREARDADWLESQRTRLLTASDGTFLAAG